MAVQINPEDALRFALTECWAVRLELQAKVQELEEKIKVLEAKSDA